MGKENEFKTTLRLNKNKPEHSKAFEILKNKESSGFRSYTDMIVHSLNSENDRKNDEATISETRVLSEIRNIIHDELSALTKN